MNLPGGLNVIASGEKVEQRVYDSPDETSTFKFSSPATKGVSMAIGDFKLSQKRNSNPPLHVYTYDVLNYPQLDYDEIDQALNFFTRTFGPLNVPVINMILKIGGMEGGLSNNGFIVLNVPEPSNRMGLGTSLPPTTIISPILTRDKTEDHVLHELAHQWWGGVISWKTYQDVWLTEGLAHFSILYYFKKHLSERRYNRIIKRLKRWVYRYSEAGPIIYGTRINLLEKNTKLIKASFTIKAPWFS